MLQARLALAPYGPTPRSPSPYAPLPIAPRPAPCYAIPRSLSAHAPLPITPRPAIYPPRCALLSLSLAGLDLLALAPPGLIEAMVQP